MRYALPCIACGRELENVEATCTNQPYRGTAFTSHGHYGSTIYDPMDGHYLEINVCDPCLALHPDRVYEGRDRRPIVEDGSITGWQEVDYAIVRWQPDPEATKRVLLETEWTPEMWEKLPPVTDTNTDT